MKLYFFNFLLTAAFQICLLSPLTWLWLSILKLLLGFHLLLFFHISDSRLWECDTRSKCFTNAMVRTALKDKSTSEGSVQASVSLLVFFFFLFLFLFFENLYLVILHPRVPPCPSTHIHAMWNRFLKLDPGALLKKKNKQTGKKTKTKKTNNHEDK